MQKKLYYASIILILGACSSSRYTILNKKIATHLDTSFFDNQFVGLLVYDPEKRDTLYSFNGHKYFTPASNTKIFTLFTALKLLPERIPALNYSISNDTLYIEGTGDPSFLHPYFNDSTAIHFLKNFNEVVFIGNNYMETMFGPGWAWEDYDSYYSAERSAFPIYGNLVSIFKEDSLKVIPNYFQDNVLSMAYGSNRDLNKNVFYFEPSRKDTLKVPFITDDELIANLLSDILQKKVTLRKRTKQTEKTTLYSVPTDSLLRYMMLESDNFIAEQLLILASSTLSDTLDGSKVQDFVLKKYLSNLQEPPRWVDGSGLSRYNLISPASLVQVLSVLYSELPQERLFNLFPVGGVSGTMKTWDNGNHLPYLYAKSGSLGNNYCLSGYLITKSGKTLVFSFMNNHFRWSTTAVKEQMKLVLEEIRDTY